MNAFTALLRTRPVRFLRLDAGHVRRRPRGFCPRLEDLESRLAPAGGGAGALGSHLGAAAQVSSTTAGGTPPGNAGPGLGAFVSPGTVQTFGRLAPAAVPLGDIAPRQTVIVTSPNPTAAEDPTGTPGVPETQETATFRITRVFGNGSGDPVTVFFTLTGTAQNGVDYVTIAGSATIPPAKNFVDITVTPFPRPPNQPLPQATVVITLNAGKDYSVGEQGSSTATIFENAVFFPRPTVSVTSPDPSASEDPAGTPGVPQTQDTATFRITRAANGDGGEGGNGNGSPLTVFFTLTGTAQNGADYVLVAGSVVIPAGQDFVDITITPLPAPARQPVPEADVVLTLVPSFSYVIGEADSATAVIHEIVHVVPTVVPPPPPVKPPPPVPPPPKTTTTPVNNAALSLALNTGPVTPHTSSTQAPFPIFLAGLPLNPALLGLPGGLVKNPFGLDQIGLVGGTNSVGQISGKIFDDFNGTGTPDRLKPGLPGVTVFIDLNNNGRLDPGEPQTTTNDAGEYVFAGLPPGTYVVRQAMSGNIVQTLPPNEAPYEVRLQRILDGAATDRDFGLQLLSGRGQPAGTPARRLPPPPTKPKETSPPTGEEESDGGPDDDGGGED